MLLIFLSGSSLLIHHILCAAFEWEREIKGHGTKWNDIYTCVRMECAVAPFNRLNETWICFLFYKSVYMYIRTCRFQCRRWVVELLLLFAILIQFVILYKVNFSVFPKFTVSQCLPCMLFYFCWSNFFYFDIHLTIYGIQWKCVYVSWVFFSTLYLRSHS